jgi:hypothetical protein
MTKKIMPDNICFECGGIIFPNETYYLGESGMIYCEFCKNTQEQERDALENLFKEENDGC